MLCGYVWGRRPGGVRPLVYARLLLTRNGIFQQRIPPYGMTFGKMVAVNPIISLVLEYG